MTSSPSPFTAPLPGAERDVAVFGEAMTLFIAGATGPLEQVEIFHRRMAGAEINVAVGLARLGLRVGWASRLGADSLGRYLLAELQKEGVCCAKVASDPQQRTGFQFKGRVDDGTDPPVEYHRKGSAASLMGPDDVDPAWLQATRHLHATGVFAAISATSLAAASHTLDVARAAGRSVSFDPNLRPSLWASTEVMRTEINRLAAKAHAVLPGLEEGRLLTGERSAEGIARFYRDAGARLVIVKLGADGAYYDDVDAGTGHLPGFPVARVVDTVGAGDGFAVGVVSALLEGRSVPDAVRRGNWIGALQVQVPGDSEGLPTRAELETAGF